MRVTVERWGGDFLGEHPVLAYHGKTDENHRLDCFALYSSSLAAYQRSQ